MGFDLEQGDDGTDLNVSPPYMLCEIKALALKIKGAIKRKKKEVKEKKDTILTKLGEILWGIFTMTGTELLKALLSIASKIVASFMGNIASIAGAAIERVLAKLLEIIKVLGPSIYLLAEVPRLAAYESALNEKDELHKINSYLNIIGTILNKWANKFTPGDYGDALRKAKPLIESALSNLASIINSLEASYGNTYFDVDVYNKANSDIQNAIKILDVDSVFEKLFNVQDAIDSESDAIFAKNEARVRKTYRGLRDKAAEEYKVKVTNFHISLSDEKAMFNDTLNFGDKYLQGEDYDPNEVGKGPHINGFKEKEEARNEYEKKLRDYSISEEADLRYERIRADDIAMAHFVGSISSGSGVVRTVIRNTRQEFKEDMHLLGDLLNKTISGIGSAYRFNKLSQTYCGSIVGFENWIEGMSKALIAILNGTSFTVSKATLQIIRAAEKMVGAAKVSVDRSISNTEGLEEKKSSLDLKAKLLYGTKNEDDALKAKKIERKSYVADANDVFTQMTNASLAKMSLEAAELILTAGITESLADIINGGAHQTEEYKAYQKLVTAIKDIPDWDGKKETWCDSGFFGAANPYVDLTSIGGSLASKARKSVSPIPIPTVGEGVTFLMNSMTDKVKEISEHNNIVTTALNKWKLEYNSTVDGYIKLLKAMDIFEIIALGLSLANMIKSIANVSKLSPKINYIDCITKYPDLFNDPDIELAILSKEVNTPAHVEDMNVAINSLNTFSTDRTDYLALVGEFDKLLMDNGSDKELFEDIEV